MNFIQVHMFIEQNRKKGYSGSSIASGSLGPTSMPFQRWKVGYIIAGNNDPEAWTIQKIDSKDGVIHNTDTEVTMINGASETKTLKGRSVALGYKFVSSGDVVEEPTAKPDPFAGRTDLQYQAISAAGIREFYPRKHGEEGVRIIMHDKTAYIVADGYNDIVAALMKAGARIVTAEEDNINRADN